MRTFGFAVTAAALLAAAASVAAQNVSNSDQLFTAIEERNGGLIMQLVQENPRIVDFRDTKGETALIRTIREGDPRWTAFLLSKGADPNLSGIGGETPLIAAARTGQMEPVTWIIGLDARIDATNRGGETALIVAVQQRNAKLVKLLLDAGADPDRTDSVAGYSARDYAMRDSRARDIQKLISDKKPKGAAK